MAPAHHVVGGMRRRRAVTCGDNHACAYDLRMSGSDAVAQATLETQQEVKDDQQRALPGDLSGLTDSSSMK